MVIAKRYTTDGFLFRFSRIYRMTVATFPGSHFAGDPNLNVDHIATEGTPPFLSPAPVKFISGTQLSAGHFDFVVTNMRASVNWVLFKGDLNTRNITAEINNAASGGTESPTTASP